MELLFLGVSEVFPGEISIWICRLSKEGHPHQCGGVIWFPEGLNKKKKKRGEEGWICSFCSGRDTCLLLPLDVSRPGSQASGLGLNYTTSSPGSLACRQQIMGLLGFHNPEPIPVINLLSSISICILLVLLLWRTLIQQVINFLPWLIHLTSDPAIATCQNSSAAGKKCRTQTG